MKKILKFILYLVLVILLIVFGAISYFWSTDEPNWHVEENAIQSISHPYAGFWKDENCKDEWGWAIGPAGDSLYYISFCGPGGCFEEGTYRPNTTIINDPKYNVIDENTIHFRTQDDWSVHVRCPSRTYQINQVRPQSAWPGTRR